MNDLPYMIKCDDCKVTLARTADVRESYAGGLCDDCRAKAQEAVQRFRRSLASNKHRGDLLRVSREQLPDALAIPSDILQEALRMASKFQHPAACYGLPDSEPDGSLEWHSWLVPGNRLDAPEAKGGRPAPADDPTCYAICWPDQTIEYLHRSPDGSLHHITTEH